MRTSITFFTALIFTVAIFADSLSAQKYEGLKTRSIEMEFFSPLTGNLTVGYEQVLNEAMSLEGRLGIIGLGVDYNNQRGSFVKGGVKFRLIPISSQTVTASSYMEGAYFKAELGYNIYQSDEYAYYNTSPEVHQQVSFQLIGGLQMTAADLLVFDGYFGMGYAIGSFDDVNYSYSHLHFGNSFPLAISTGFSVGILLN